MTFWSLWFLSTAIMWSGWLMYDRAHTDGRKARMDVGVAIMLVGAWLGGITLMVRGV